MGVASGARPWLVAAAILVVASTAGAQDWDQPWADPLDRPGRLDISASTGYHIPTDWSDIVLLGSISPAFGILEQVLVQNVRVRADVAFNANATYWQGRYGARFDAAYSRSSLSIGGVPPGGALDDIRVRTWLYGVRGAVGLVDYTPQRRTWPYAFVGLGGITYDLAEPVAPPLLTFIEHGGPVPDSRARLVLTDNGREFLLQINQLDLETVLAFSYGIGVDLRVPFGPGSVGVRLEAGDTVARSPLRVQVQELGAPATATRVGLGRVHHLRATAGIVVTVGR